MNNIHKIYASDRVLGNCMQLWCSLSPSHRPRPLQDPYLLTSFFNIALIGANSDGQAQFASGRLYQLAFSISTLDLLLVKLLLSRLVQILSWSPTQLLGWILLIDEMIVSPALRFLDQSTSHLHCQANGSDPCEPLAHGVGEAAYARGAAHPPRT